MTWACIRRRHLLHCDMGAEPALGRPQLRFDLILAQQHQHLERENRHRAGLPADGAYQALLIRS